MKGILDFIIDIVKEPSILVASIAILGLILQKNHYPIQSKVELKHL